MTVKNLLHAIKPFDWLCCLCWKLKNVKYCLSLRSKIFLNIISEFSGMNSHSDLDHYGEDTGKAVAMQKSACAFRNFRQLLYFGGPLIKNICPIIRLSCCVSIDFFSVHIDLYRGAEDTVLICNPAKVRNAPSNFLQQHNTEWALTGSLE